MFLFWHEKKKRRKENLFDHKTTLMFTVHMFVSFGFGLANVYSHKSLVCHRHHHQYTTSYIHETTFKVLTIISLLQYEYNIETCTRFSLWIWMNTKMFILFFCDCELNENANNTNVRSEKKSLLFHIYSDVIVFTLIRHPLMSINLHNSRELPHITTITT